MQNYGVFTQIYVLKKFRENKQKKSARKATKMAKAGNAKCHDKFHHCHEKTKGK